MNTEIFKVSDVLQQESELKCAAEVIKQGRLVVFPTETVYGIGADATDEAAVSAIFTAKGRPSDNPLIVHVSAPSDAEKYAYTSPLYFKIAEKFMPGPITVIMPSREIIPKKTRGGLDTVAIRCPSSEIARALTSFSKKPIAAPSANLSGSPSPTSAKHVIDDMQGRVDVIIDGGDCDFGLESTIVKIEDDNTLLLLRPGKITIEELEEIVPVKVADAVTDKLRDGEVALSPGMKYRHYAPKAPLILIDGSSRDFIDYVNKSENEKIAVIAYYEDVELIKSALPYATVYDFGKAEDESAQAHNLFYILRDADSKNFDKIYAPLPKKTGISLAIYNRMIRAAAHTIIRL